MANHVHGGRQGLGFGVKQAAIPAGAVLAGLVVPLAISVSWRLPFALGAILPLAALLVAPRYTARHDERHNDAAESPALPAPLPASGMGAPLRLLAVAAGLAGGIGNSLAAFLADAGVDKGFSEANASRLLTLGSAIAIATRVGSGATADQEHRSGATELLTLLLLAAVGFAVLAASGGSSVVFVVGVVIAFAGAWGWPGVMYYMVTRTSDLAAGSATGRVLAGAYLGTVVLPPIAGWTVETFSFAAAFLGGAVLAVLSALAVLASRSLLARQRAREAL